MVGRFIPIMAGLAVGLAAVVEVGVLPVGGIMAVGALAIIVVCRPVAGVTGFTIPGTRHGMIEVGRKPGTCVVTGSALAAIVPCWFIILMAADTIQATHQGMIESHILPGIGVVARTTCTFVMISRSLVLMTGFTPVRGPFINPICMAIRTFKRTMGTYQ